MNGLIPCAIFARQLKDLLRASILCRNMSEIKSVWRALERLEEEGILIGENALLCVWTDRLSLPWPSPWHNTAVVTIVKNRFRGVAQGSGYRDLNVAVVFQGFVCEIQVRGVFYWLRHGQRSSETNLTTPSAPPPRPPPPPLPARGHSLQIHSIAHYSLKKYEHPTYTLCRSYGLIGDLDETCYSESRVTKKDLGPKMAITIFALRLTTWALSWFFCWMHLTGGIMGKMLDAQCVWNDGIFITAWALSAQAFPYLILSAVLVKDMVHSGKAQMWASIVTITALLAYVIFASLVWEDTTFEGESVNMTNALLHLSQDYACPKHFLLLSSVPTISMVLVVGLLYRHNKVGPSKIRRVGLLYERYFGINGSYFAWKVAALQSFTVVLQALGRLTALAHYAGGASNFHFGSEWFTAIYWLYFCMLAINAVVPPVLLQSESAFWQRTVVCFIDVALDMLYTMVFLIFLLSNVRFPSDMFALAPVDQGIIRFSSSVFPLLHILSVCRAVELHVTAGDKGAETSRAEPLPRRSAIGFGVFNLLAITCVILMDTSLYPFHLNRCAPCKCDAEGVLVICDFNLLPSLELHGRGITHIKPGVFKDLSGIERLYLHNNEISVLDPATFDGLSGLHVLKLYGNHISNLERGVFDGLSGLHVLELYRNQISNLEPGVFDGLSGLERLNLGTNQISTLESGCFEGLSNLQELILDNNQISVLGAGAFDGLVGLQMLWLFDNNISSMDLDVYEGLSNLKCVFLGGNKVCAIDPSGRNLVIPSVAVDCECVAVRDCPSC